jgi:hypothetical protein
LPDDLEKWALHHPLGDEEVDKEDDNDSLDAATSTLTSDATDGYDRLKNKQTGGGAAGGPPKVKKNKENETPQSEEFKKYQEEKALRAQLLRDEILGDVTVSQREDESDLVSLKMATPSVTLRNDSAWDPTLARDTFSDPLKQYEEVFTASRRPHDGVIDSDSQSTSSNLTVANRRRENVSGGEPVETIGFEDEQRLGNRSPNSEEGQARGSPVESSEKIAHTAAGEISRHHHRTPFTNHPEGTTAPALFPLPSTDQPLLNTIDNHLLGTIVESERHRTEEQQREGKEGDEQTNLYLQNFASNSFTGRIGESLARSLLASSFPDGEIQEIIWLNESVEQLHPYDLLVTYSNGVERYCEVKTRLWSELTEGGPYVPQWFISATEIEAAMRYEERYFCILIALGMKKGAVEAKDVQFLGYERGLMDAMKTRQAHLILQLLPPSLGPERL